MNIYISGPMTGHDQLNFPMFHAAEKLLLETGHKPVNPARLPQTYKCPKTGKTKLYTYNELLTVCLETIAIMCDAILVLPDWHTSRGAKAEFNLAMKLNLKVINYHELLQ